MGTKLTTGQLAILASLTLILCVVASILVVVVVRELRPTPAPPTAVATTDTATLAPPATDTPIVEVTPTGTPTATQTPVLITVAPPQPQEPSCTNGNQSLNVRGGPGTIYPVVGALDRNQTAPVVGQNSGWWKLNIPGDFWASGGEGYCKGNEAASNVPFINAPPTPTPTATLTPTPTLTPTVGVPCGGCRNVGNPQLCHPVDLAQAVPSGAFCVSHGWWDSPTETGRVLLEAPILAGDPAREPKPLRYEGWFSLPASLPSTLGFTNVVTRPQVVGDDHLVGIIIDQVPDEAVHWWWPSSAPITLTIGIAPELQTVPWTVEGTVKIDNDPNKQSEPFFGAEVQAWRQYDGKEELVGVGRSDTTGHYTISAQLPDTGTLRVMMTVAGFPAQVIFPQPTSGRTYSADFVIIYHPTPSP